MAEKAAQESFHKFFEAWVLRQHNFLHQLLSLSLLPHDSVNGTDQHNALIDQVLSHYQLYFDQKSTLANFDVFVLFSPTWLSSYERALLWISDYRPTLVLRLLDGAVGGITPEQRRRLDTVKEETRREERAVTETMTSVQESVTGPAVLRSARRMGRGRVFDGEVSEMDAAMERVKRAMVGVLERADELRVSTVRKEIRILSPPQTVQFPAAALQFQVCVRKWGLQRDSEIPDSESRALCCPNQSTVLRGK